MPDNDSEIQGFAQNKTVKRIRVEVRAECASISIDGTFHIEWESDAPFNQQTWRSSSIISRSAAAKLSGVSEEFLCGFEQGVLKSAAYLREVRTIKEKYAGITNPSIIRDMRKGLAALEKFIERLSAEPVSDRLIGEKKPVPAKVPEAISDLVELQRFDHGCCVYFLCKFKKVVYVGQTDHISSRVRCHKKDKDFDEVFYICVPEKYLLATERHFIKKLDPPLNRAETSRSRSGRKKRGVL